jgi:hypothetical protein
MHRRTLCSFSVSFVVGAPVFIYFFFFRFVCLGKPYFVISVHSIIIGSISKSVLGTQRFSLRLRQGCSALAIIQARLTSYTAKFIFGALGSIVIIFCISISYFVILEFFVGTVVSAKVAKKMVIILANYVASFIWFFVSPFTGNLHG